MASVKGIILLLMYVLVLTACAGFETESPTGRTAVVKILEQEVKPRDVTVRPGMKCEFLTNVPIQPGCTSSVTDPKNCPAGAAFLFSGESKRLPRSSRGNR